jgi:membrane protein
VTPESDRSPNAAALLVQVFRRALNGLWRDDVMFYAAAIAFNSLFSIFALLFLLSILLSLFGASPQNLQVLNALGTGLVPEKAQEFVSEILDQTSRPVPAQLLPVALLMTLWTASNVVQNLIHALNRIYYLEEGRAFWRTRLMALAVVGMSALFLVLGFLLMVFGEDVMGGAHEVRWVRSRIAQGILLFKQPLAIVAVFLGSQLIYWLAPSFKHEHRVSWPGAVTFTLTWVLATLGFNLYLREIAVYDRVYGPMATVVVVLIWVQVSAVLALFGGEVNAAVHRMRRDEEDLRRKVDQG